MLRADETGLLTLKRAAEDLWLEAQLDQWAEPIQDGRWQLTPASVTAHVKAGARIDELITLLTKRLVNKLPPLLEMALRNWAGRAKTVQLDPFVVLRCHNDAALNAILESKRLQPYLRGRLEDGVLLFDSAHLAEVREILSWTGLTLADFSL